MPGPKVEYIIDILLYIIVMVQTVCVVGVLFGTHQQIERVIIIFLSKGCSRRSWNIWPTGAQRFSRRPWAYRRTWSTRCKGNTEKLGILVLIYYIYDIIIFTIYYILCLHPTFPLLIFFISLSKGLTGTPGVQGAEGKPGPLVGYSAQSH